MAPPPFKNHFMAADAATATGVVAVAAADEVEDEG